MEPDAPGARKILRERKCRACPTTIRSGTLGRHHLVRKGSPHFGEDLDENLIPLCQACHMRFHGSPDWAEVGAAIRMTLALSELRYMLRRAGRPYIDRYYPRKG